MSLTIEALDFRYPDGNAALHAVSLDVQAGALCAVIGPSGCGKSTLLKLIAGFLTPTAGSIHIGGQNMAGLEPKRRNLGVVFQNYALFPHMTALENVAYPLMLRGVARAERRRMAGTILERAQLGAYLDRLPGMLSGGQQQRVALARALVFRPAALLLDEPLSALDVANRQTMRDEIRTVQREFNVATLHVTHDQEEALSIADTVAVMRGGHLLQVATPQELYRNPADRFVAGFVGQANLWPARILGPGMIETPIGNLHCDTGKWRPGAAVIAMVRPEAIIANPTDTAAALPAQIKRDRFLGAQRRLDLAISTGTGTGIALLDTPLGGNIHSIAIPPDAVKLLPPDHQPETGAYP